MSNFELKKVPFRITNPDIQMHDKATYTEVISMNEYPHNQARTGRNSLMYSSIMSAESGLLKR